MSELLNSEMVGIDVSHHKLDIAYLGAKGWEFEKIPNTWTDAQTFAASLRQRMPNCWCIAEYTGTYSSKVALALFLAGVKVTLITPMQSRAFARLKHRTTKNDRSDARLLAEYGTFNEQDLKLYAPPSDEQVHFRQVLDAIGQLEKQRQQSRNQLHAYEQLPPAHQQQMILDCYKKTDEHFTEQIEKLEASLDELDQHDEDTEKTRKLMISIKGVGKKTVDILMAKTRGITRFPSAKQLAKFIGTAPTERSSGSSIRGKRSINRSGNASIRRVLYCATWSAVRSNKACKALYERLRASGKPVKVALIAVANLLIRQIYAVVTSQKPFNNDHYHENYVKT